MIGLKSVYVFNTYVSLLKLLLMAKSCKPVDFDCCVSTIQFTPSENLVEVRKVHYDKDKNILSDSLVAIPLTSNTFESAMQIASAIASNVGLVEYVEK